MTHLLYIVGEPGVGKSSFAAALTGNRLSYVVRKPFARTVWATEPPVVELGVRREGFPGTDALSMSVQPVALQWLREEQPSLVLGEGDRLGTLSFLRGALECGYSVTVAHLVAPPAVVAYRREKRALELGRPVQDDKWVAGRVTKVQRLVAELAFATREIETSDPAVMVKQLYDDPVVQALVVKEAVHANRA